MFKRPSSRRKSKNEQINLNLVPILDTMVTLIGFLLFTMSFLAFVSIESPVPMAGSEIQKEKLKEKPLQLTLTLRTNETEIWSPFEKIKAVKIPHNAEGQPDLKLIHEALLSIKTKFPQETKIVFVPYANTNYDTMVSVMDAIRSIEATDPPIYAKNATTGNDEALKMLFPEVIFGNLLGDT